MTCWDDLGRAWTHHRWRRLDADQDWCLICGLTRVSESPVHVGARDDTQASPEGTRESGGDPWSGC